VAFRSSRASAAPFLLDVGRAALFAGMHSFWDIVTKDTWNCSWLWRMVAGGWRESGGLPGPLALPAQTARNAARNRKVGGTSSIPGAAAPAPPPSPTVLSSHANAAAAGLAAAAREAVAASSAQNNQDGGMPQDGDGAGAAEGAAEQASQSSDAAMMSNAVATNYSRRFATTLKKAGLAPAFDEYNQSNVSLDSICIIVLLWSWLLFLFRRQIQLRRPFVLGIWECMLRQSETVSALYLSAVKTVIPEA
jgi:hypothetical protein